MIDGEWVSTTAGECWGRDKLAHEVALMWVNGANYRYCDACRANPVIPKHDEGCDEWCNHCEVCSTGILYGARCPEHPNVAGWSRAYREAWFAERAV